MVAICMGIDSVLGTCDQCLKRTSLTEIFRFFTYLYRTQFLKFPAWKNGSCSTHIPLTPWLHDTLKSWINYLTGKSFQNWSKKTYSSGSKTVEPNVNAWITAFEEYSYPIKVNNKYVAPVHLFLVLSIPIIPSYENCI